MQILNKLFSKIVIPIPILEDEIIIESLGSLQYQAGIIANKIGYRIFIELGNSDDKMAKRLSDYDRPVIAIAAEGGLLAISNDKPVREICKKYDIEITGTIGILSAAYENKLISYSKMENAFKYLFSDNSSCYLSSRLKSLVFDHYSIEDDV